MTFEVSKNLDDYNGRALADLLASKIYRIKCVHDYEYEEKTHKFQIEDKDRNIETEYVPDPIGNEELDVIGNISAGALSINLLKIILFGKRLFNQKYRTFSCSIQKYVSEIRIIVRIDGKNDKKCHYIHHSSHFIDACGVIREGKDDLIPILIEEIAFKISHEYSHARTWQGFKYFTKSLDNYQKYERTKIQRYLDQAKNDCIKIERFEENKYTKISGLMQNLAVEYWDNEDYETAKDLFLRLNEIKKDGKVFYALGCLAYFDFDGENSIDEALKAFEEAVSLEPQLKEAWFLIGSIQESNSNFKEALNALNKVIDIDENDSGAWNQKGLILDKMGNHHEAELAYDKADKIGDIPIITQWWPSDRREAKNYVKRKEDEKKLEKGIASLDPDSNP